MPQSQEFVSIRLDQTYENWAGRHGPATVPASLQVRAFTHCISNMFPHSLSTPYRYSYNLNTLLFLKCLMYSTALLPQQILRNAAMFQNTTVLVKNVVTPSLSSRFYCYRIVYASATGATEPRNMAYMSRIGLWGPGSPFTNYNHFIQV